MTKTVYRDLTFTFPRETHAEIAAALCYSAAVLMVHRKANPGIGAATGDAVLDIAEMVLDIAEEFAVKGTSLKDESEHE